MPTVQPSCTHSVQNKVCAVAIVALLFISHVLLSEPWVNLRIDVLVAIRTPEPVIIVLVAWSTMQETRVREHRCHG